MAADAGPQQEGIEPGNDVVRVIAGKAKGMRLIAPAGSAVRPTLDRVREALFSILGERVVDTRFLDLFAGSGANGIEALSRGARFAAFVDSDRRSLATVERNLETTRLAESAEVHRLVLPKGLSALARLGEPFGLVFADPPYDFVEYESLLNGLCHNNLLSPGGMVIVEHAARVSILSNSLILACSRRAEYGDTALSFFS